MKNICLNEEKCICLKSAIFQQLKSLRLNLYNEKMFVEYNQSNSSKEIIKCLEEEIAILEEIDKELK